MNNLGSVLVALENAEADGNSTLCSFRDRNKKLDTAQQVKEFIDEMEKFPRITALELTGNTFGTEAAVEFSKALQHRSELERALWSDMFTSRSKTEIPPALKSLTGALCIAGAHLLELDLSDNAFGPVGVEGIQDFLRSPAAYSLQVLKLNNNGLGQGGAKLLTEALMDCYESSLKAGQRLQLRTFIAGRNRLENYGAINLAKVFEKMSSLEHVSMPQNGIYADGIIALSKALAKNCNLQTLNLMDNTFTSKGGCAMAKALTKLPRLEIVNFGDCLLRNEGAIAVAKALANEHSALKELHLNGNEITERAMRSIVDAVRSKPNLTRLDLNANTFGSVGIKSVKQQLRDAHKLDILASLSDDEGTPDASETEEGQADGADVSTNSADEASEQFAGGSTEFIREQAPECDQQLRARPLPDVIAAVQNGGVGGFASRPQQAVTGHRGLTAEHLVALGATQAVQFANRDVSFDDADMVVSHLLTLASLLEMRNRAQTEQIICQCCDHLLQQAGTHQANWSNIVNILAMKVGFIKSEDRAPSPSNMYGVLVVLTHVVKQPYFPQLHRDVLAFLCINKPTPNAVVGNEKQFDLLRQALIAR